MMKGLKLKMLAMPRAKQRIMERMPNLRGWLGQHFCFLGFM